MVLTRARSRLARTQETTKTFRILDLPAELVLQIFELLAEDDRVSILAARSACRTLRDHSFVAFGTSFFEHVVVILHPISLTALLEIATHKQLSPFVRKVTVSGERIGAVINLEGQGNEATLKDLQTSMENSGMDHLTLSDILLKLQNICIVRIDCVSFCCESDCVDALLCGRKNIIDRNREWKSGDDLDQCVNRAYSVTLSSIKDAGIEELIDLELGASIIDDNNHYDNYFDPNSSDWLKHYSNNVTAVKATKQATCPWVLDLLGSTPNLEQLELEFSDEPVEFRQAASRAIFMWARLRSIDLFHTPCDDAITPFLDLHKDTLSSVRLHGIELVKGTWKDVLPVITTLPKLEYLYLRRLDQYHANQCCDRFESFYDIDAEEVQELFHGGKAGIATAIEAVLLDFRTVQLRPHLLHTVDFRLGNAIMAGIIEFSAGNCESKAFDVDGQNLSSAAL